jgi:hypothetical protein
MTHRAKVFGEAFDMPQQEKLGEAVTGTNTYYSLPVRLGEEAGLLSVHTGWTGTTAGTLTLWYSNLLNPNLANDDDWDDDAAFASAVSNPAGSAGNTFVPGSGASGVWVREKYVSTSGTGTLWSWITVGK